MVRLPTIAADAMVATSHPLATRAGVRALEAGGNAVDAALAAAAMLTVCEPPHNGVGGDAFALLWFDGALHGLNGSGRAPAHIDELTVDSDGPRSVTVAGAVRAWADAAERFGRLGLDAALAGAVDAARNGVAATARIAEHWRRAQARAPWPAPRPGERYRLPDLAGTLQAIADRGPDALYRGPIAAAIAAASWLSEDDLAAHRSEWVTPLRRAYRGVEVCELPPNTQGAAALVGLAIAEELDGDLHGDVEAAKFALDWAARRSATPPSSCPTPPRCGRASGRGPRPTRACGRAAGRRTCARWTASATRCRGSSRSSTASARRGRGRHGDPAAQPRRGLHHGGGPSQPDRAGQAPVPHDHPGPAAARRRAAGALRGHGRQHAGAGPLPARAPRGRPGPRSAGGARRRALPRPRRSEPRAPAGLAAHADDLRARGHDVEVAEVPHGFGVGQMILAEADALVGGSDGRADGHAAGL